MKITAVIMAAGKGTRLKSDVPKVLHEVCGRPMLAYVFDACREAGLKHCIAVVGHGKDQVIRAFTDPAQPETATLGDLQVTWVEQNPQLGTGHAVMVCREALQGFEHTLVLGGDGPLIRAAVVKELLEKHLAEQSSATLATAVLDDPTGYGRIARDAAGKLCGIVEHADATPEQRAIREVNPSYYCFNVADLLAALDRTQPNNKKGEYYITDALAILIQAGKKTGAITSVHPDDIYSINSRAELAMVNDVLRRRILDRWMDDGVTIVDPATTWIDNRAVLGRDTIIEPFVRIAGGARIGANCRVGPLVYVPAHAVIADNTLLVPQGGTP